MARPLPPAPFWWGWLNPISDLVHVLREARDPGANSNLDLSIQFALDYHQGKVEVPDTDYYAALKDYIAKHQASGDRVPRHSYNVDLSQAPTWLGSNSVALFTYLSIMHPYLGPTSDNSPSPNVMNTINSFALADAFRTRELFSPLGSYIDKESPLFAAPPMIFKVIGMIEGGNIPGAEITMNEYNGAVQNAKAIDDKAR